MAVAEKTYERVPHSVRSSILIDRIRAMQKMVSAGVFADDDISTIRSLRNSRAELLGYYEGDWARATLILLHKSEDYTSIDGFDDVRRLVVGRIGV